MEKTSKILIYQTKRVFTAFIFLFVIYFPFKFAFPTAVIAQTCSSLTVDKATVKATDNVTFTSNASSNADNFFFGIYNLDNPDGSGGFKPVCVSSGGDANTPSPSCPAGSYPLMFKDPNSASRLTGTRTLLSSELFLNDQNIFRPFGAKLERAQIIAYVSTGTGPLSPVNSSCTATTQFYRPPVCVSSVHNPNILTPSQPVQITLTGNPPAGTTIAGFTLAFYNADNPYWPGNDKPIIFGGQQYMMSVTNTSGGNSYTFTVTYNDLNRLDENWANQYPVRIHTNGYFTLSDGGFSKPEANCVDYFTVQRAAGPNVSLPPPGWFAPDGTLCNRTNYQTFYTQTSCAGQTGYTTENISPQSQCSTDGSGKCFQAGGQQFNQQIKSYWRFDSQACVPVTSPYTPVNTYDTLYQCRFGIPPVSVLNGKVTVNYTNNLQFDKIYVWINDTQDNYARYYELNKAQIRSGQPISYSFSNLFPDKKYDIYVKAYGTGGVFLDNVVYTGTCGAASCRILPNNQLDFSLNFPAPPPGSSTNSTTNEEFVAQIDKWIKGQIGPLQMSQFIKQISRVPGLQKATCDPRVPGGCLF
ncbi:hypothetical protein A3D05_02905 [Candidatus Gottesmanbacteria bacterium RIFCSPHIGHO2_02_FULL_40_24]|uniref:Uncharacterized protein n=1 Tax=Candidatus Gottesmanbacteria bacterium RIFCSPHIGHO2_01_FULL_40_15 TaxID=1798376 RepID=A0A1F5YZJ0_9BACT|nr:MAG: hypothetical protein A2777_00415 [Candidatus Gottesmanbacteria bacterium RIFCSPHIGHO2_01_FULL_40_15]OGG17456.1 MAG: hypothetical protein A3D05_02905 [Candidatus Gottesmanbacteria bacterium RIFCSPHIGHO2_02_FULL_40_24]OGG20953.1 MAG: hypothetical protein A3B48_00750 [Candidatus Gottesmanbacteria bacterium RIFCSPLOWO2_01_FULL_40_10]OGG25096.1 MAG: hypothetical protein A3E42_00825 [Candidatus Gottesmanbacteria bacterium RIFCSPHIGHO2_12_FULL_40_13]